MKSDPHALNPSKGFDWLRLAPSERVIENVIGLDAGHLRACFHPQQPNALPYQLTALLYLCTPVLLYSCTPT